MAEELPSQAQMHSIAGSSVWYLSSEEPSPSPIDVQAFTFTHCAHVKHDCNLDSINNVARCDQQGESSRRAGFFSSRTLYHTLCHFYPILHSVQSRAYSAVMR